MGAARALEGSIESKDGGGGCRGRKFNSTSSGEQQPSKGWREGRAGMGKDVRRSHSGASQQSTRSSVVVAVS